MVYWTASAAHGIADRQQAPRGLRVLHPGSDPALHLQFFEEGYDTLAGFILNSVGDIPRIEKKINYQQYQITVKSIEGNRIDKIHLIKI